VKSMLVFAEPLSISKLWEINEEMRASHIHLGLQLFRPGIWTLLKEDLEDERMRKSIQSFEVGWGHPVGAECSVSLGRSGLVLQGAGLSTFE